MSDLKIERGQKTFDLICLGRVAVDFNPVDYNKPLSECTTFKKYLGGSPANIAVGLSKLKGKVGFFARVSDDQFGDFVTDYFKKENIDTSHISRCTGGEKIGLTFTEIKSPNESSILMYRNCAADLSLSPDDIDEKYIESGAALLISGTSLAKSPSREAALKAAELAKKFGLTVIFDIDYRPYNWTSLDEITVYYSIVAEMADILLGSREEFDLTERFFGLDGTDFTSASYWHKKGVKLLVIKHGKEGSNAFVKDGKKYKVLPMPIKKLKGFGGGDGYASALLYGLTQGWELPDALEFGAASASLLIASHACSEDMPNEAKIRNYLNEIHSQSKEGYVTEI